MRTAALTPLAADAASQKPRRAQVAEATAPRQAGEPIMAIDRDPYYRDRGRQDGPYGGSPYGGGLYGRSPYGGAAPPCWRWWDAAR